MNFRGNGGKRLWIERKKEEILVQNKEENETDTDHFCREKERRQERMERQSDVLFGRWIRGK